jgi:hypothetical protein
MHYSSDFYADALDNWVSKYSDKTMRIYDAAKNGLTLPAGNILADFVIPNPSHNAAGFNGTANRYEATMAGTWSDATANLSGTPRSFVVGISNADGTFTVKATGTAGGPSASPVPELLLNADTLSAGAPFSITKFLQVLNLAA